MKRVFKIVGILGAMVVLLATLLLGLIWSGFKHVPFVGMDTSRRYFVYQWSDEPVGVGAAIVTRDHRQYFYVKPGWTVQSCSPPEDRFREFLLYDSAGIDGTDTNSPDPVAVVNHTLRFNMGDGEHPDYVEFKLKEHSGVTGS
jgi:hypothetical protein